MAFEFGKFGRIVDISIKRDMAFIEFERERDGITAVHKMDNKFLDGVQVKVDKYRSKIVDKDTCFNCGERGHWMNKCPNQIENNDRCYCCGVQGHI